MFKAKPYKDQPVAYAHLKLDGHRVEVVDRVFKTRLGHDLSPKLRKYDWFDKLPYGVRYEAELVTSLGVHRVKSYPDDLRIVGFSTPELPDNSLLEDVELWFDSFGIAFAPFHRLRPGWTVEELLDSAREQQQEGWILKNVNYIDWYKLKVVDTVDLYVCDVNPGQGKYHGLIGSLVLCDEFNRVKAFVSGMTDAEREYLTARWVSGRLLGRCVEIKHNGPTSRGRFRHPQFLRMRDDEKSNP